MGIHLFILKIKTPQFLCWFLVYNFLLNDSRQPLLLLFINIFQSLSNKKSSQKNLNCRWANKNEYLYNTTSIASFK